MPIITLLTCQLEFENALISVPSDGSNWDWTCENWIDTPQQIEITQKRSCAVITGITGYGAEKGVHRISEITPPIRSLTVLINYLILKTLDTKVEESKIRQSIKVENFNWGNVVSLRWSDLGYAPGGDENYLLPATKK